MVTQAAGMLISEWLPLLREVLAREEQFRWRLRGTSMLPTLPPECELGGHMADICCTQESGLRVRGRAVLMRLMERRLPQLRSFCSCVSTCMGVSFGIRYL